MSSTTIYETTASRELTEAGDGYVLHDEARDRVHFLNPTAAIVYELCDGGCALPDLLRHLEEGLSLDAPPHEDVQACLDTLETERLIRKRN